MYLSASSKTPLPSQSHSFKLFFFNLAVRIINQSSIKNFLTHCLFYLVSDLERLAWDRVHGMKWGCMSGWLWTLTLFFILSHRVKHPLTWLWAIVQLHQMPIFQSEWFPSVKDIVQIRCGILVYHIGEYFVMNCPTYICSHPPQSCHHKDPTYLPEQHSVPYRTSVGAGRKQTQHIASLLT